MNLSPGWVERLVNHGFEAVHWSTIGAETAPDVEILTWANEHHFVIITNDLDFSAILAAGAVDGPSVVQVRTQDLLSDAAVSIVARIVDDELWNDVKERQAAMRRVTSNGDPTRFNRARRPKFLFSGPDKMQRMRRRVRDVLARPPGLVRRACSRHVHQSPKPSSAWRSKTVCWLHSATS